MNKRPAIQSLCLALPAYNEAAVIGELLRQGAEVLAGTGLDWRVVVVDDGSADETAAIVERAGVEEPRIEVVRHDINRGLGPAILTCLQEGLKRAPVGGESAHLVVCMDADLTHPPQTIPSMVACANGEAVEGTAESTPAAEGADLVIASRYQPGSIQKGVPPFRLLLSVGARVLFWWYLRMPGVRDYTCGFRGFRGDLIARGLDRFGAEGLITRSGFACTDELLVHLAMTGPVIREVPFELRYDRKIGESKMDIGLTVKETIKLLRVHREDLRRERKSGQ